MEVELDYVTSRGVTAVTTEVPLSRGKDLDMDLFILRRYMQLSVLVFPNL